MPKKTKPKSEARPWVGRPLTRKEEPRLVRGQGKFIDDFKLPGMVYMKLVRSPYGHARVAKVNVDAAESHPGVLCTLTGVEVARLVQPFIEIGPEPGGKIVDLPMASDVARYQGEPVAAVIAESRHAAEDAAELVEVDYDPLPPVMDAEEALRDRTVLHAASGTNKVWEGVFEYGDVEKAFKQAAHIIHIDRLHCHRFSSTPLESNAIISQWDLSDQRIRYWCNNSFPTFAIQFLSPALGVRIDQIRVETHDIGGSFGIKITNYPYMAIGALASRKCGGRPVKWTETRSEHLTASAHGNERTFRDTRVALDKNGVITALTSRHIDDCGAYPRYEPLGCVIWSQVFPGCYRFRNARIDFSQAVTNKCPVGPNRGYSRMQHLWFLERVIDLCAHELRIPADEMRLRNYIRPEQFPYTTPNGCIYDSGNYPKMLEMAKELVEWDHWKKVQAEERAKRNRVEAGDPPAGRAKRNRVEAGDPPAPERHRVEAGDSPAGRLIGIGIGTTLDSGTNNFGQSQIINPNAPYSGQSQAASAKLDIYGEIVVAVGSVPQGQGHETTAAQVVADVLGVHPDLVSVRVGFDTERNVHTGHSGTYASQFAVSGLSAVHGAVQMLKSEILRLAAFVLKAPRSRLEMGVGKQGPEVRVKGTDRSVNYWRLANLANVNTAVLPRSLLDVTLNCRYTWRAPFKVPDIKRKYGNLTLTYASQLHIAVMEIERDTCRPRILAYAAVDDCGRVINPTIVEGQVHGAAAHGIGAALMETCAYSSDGNMLTSTFSSYMPITSLNMPTLRCGHLETPSPHSYNGAKGMGEGGAAPLHTISAALQDALYASGVIISDSHNTPDSIFAALARARGKGRDPNVRTEHHKK